MRSARVDPVDVHRGAAPPAGGLQRLAQPGVGGRRVDQPHERGGHHVGAGFQERDELGQRLVGPLLTEGRVDDRIGAQGDEGVEVIGGDDTGRGVEAAELGGVAAHLRRAGGVHPDELEGRVLDDGAEGVDTDVAGRELDHTEGHGGHPARWGRRLRPSPHRGDPSPGAV